MSFNSPYDPANGNGNQYPNNPNPYQQTPPPNFDYSAVPAYGSGPEVPPTGKNSTLSIVSLVLSFVLPIVGLVLSIVAVRQADETGDNKGLAKAGIILGAVFTVLSVIFWIGLFVVMMMSASTGATAPSSSF